MNGSYFSFLFPEALWLLLCLVPFFIQEKALYDMRKKKAVLFLKKPFNFSSYFFLRAVGFGVVWVFLVLTVMWPVGVPHLLSEKNKAHENETKPHEIIFLVDTSASMGVEDGKSGESRLEEAKVLIDDLLEQLEGQTLSLYAFTSILTPIVPATMDYLFLRLQADRLQIDEGGVGGTEFLPVFESLKKQLFAYKTYSLVLFSDGGDSRLVTKPYDWSPFDLHLYTIGIGSKEAKPVPNLLDHTKTVLSALEEEKLKALQGTYFSSEKDSLWEVSEKLIKAISTEETKEVHLKNQSVVDWKSPFLDYTPYFQIPLGIALFFYGLLVLGFRVAR